MRTQRLSLLCVGLVFAFFSQTAQAGDFGGPFRGAAAFGGIRNFGPDGFGAEQNLGKSSFSELNASGFRAGERFGPSGFGGYRENTLGDQLRGTRLSAQGYRHDQMGFNQGAFRSGFNMGAFRSGFQQDGFGLLSSGFNRDQLYSPQPTASDRIQDSRTSNSAGGVWLPSGNLPADRSAAPGTSPANVPSQGTFKFSW